MTPQEIQETVKQIISSKGVTPWAVKVGNAENPFLGYIGTRNVYLAATNPEKLTESAKNTFELFFLKMANNK